MAISQRDIDRVRLMPDLPSPYAMKDWNAHARAYEALVFDFDAAGDFLPLIWWDKTRRNFDRDTFGLYSYVGAKKTWAEDHHEGINCIATVLGSSLAGIDMRNQNSHNWVLMCENYFNRDNGLDLFLNTTNARSGRSFWYELYPTILAIGLHACYPHLGGFRDEILIAATRWRDASIRMSNRSGVPDFNWTAFDFSSMEPIFGGRHREPEAAAAVAWIEYMAHAMSGDPKYLETSRWALDYMEGQQESIFYEVLLPYGAYAAARMNAEHGTDYDVQKLLNWCFDGTSVCRPGWGVIAERWGEVDCHGLCGSLIDWGQYVLNVDTTDMERNIKARGGYAFTMNTFSLAGAFVPIVRYDPRFATTIGKWMLNAANAARLFYPDAHDRMHQSCWFWTGDPDNLIAYEGLRKEWDGRAPYATGDPIRFSWGAIDRGLYGSSHVGFFGGIIDTTDVEGLLRLDCTKTDFHRGQSYPTWLYYNPHHEEKRVSLPFVKPDERIYDTVSKRFVEFPAQGRTALTIPGGRAAVAVIVPNSAQITRSGNAMQADGVTVDFMVDD